MIKFPLLEPQDIEVKVKQLVKTGALLLLYKTSRTDAKILDEVVGPMNWCNEYKMIGDQLYCGVGLRESEDKPFVWKWDVGIESEQVDDNKYKAQSSDAMKRSCSRWGIGAELYTSPQIWANVATEERGGKWYLSDKFAKYIVTEIDYDRPTRTITKLTICNAKSGVEVFSWTMPTTGAMMKKMNKISANRAAESGETPGKKAAATESPKGPVTSAKPKSEDTSLTEEKKPLKILVTEIGRMVKTMYKKESNSNKYNEIIAEVTGGKEFKCNAAKEEDYDTVLTIHDKLIAAGYGA